MMECLNILYGVIIAFECVYYYSLVNDPKYRKL